MGSNELKSQAYRPGQEWLKAFIWIRPQEKLSSVSYEFFDGSKGDAGLTTDGNSETVPRERQ